MKKTKTTIGRKDKASFPKLDLKHVSIKVDTGAYTSAIHCHMIKIKEANGEKVLTFTLLDPSHDQYKLKEFTVTKYKEKQVKNSFGNSEKRFVIETDITLFGETHSIELSLSERGKMRFPILMGRRFLMVKFIVDPSKYDLSHKLYTKSKLAKPKSSKSKTKKSKSTNSKSTKTTK